MFWCKKNAYIINIIPYIYNYITSKLKQFQKLFNGNKTFIQWKKKNKIKSNSHARKMIIDNAKINSFFFLKSSVIELQNNKVSSGM